MESLICSPLCSSSCLAMVAVSCTGQLSRQPIFASAAPLKISAQHDPHSLPRLLTARRPHRNQALEGKFRLLAKRIDVDAVPQEQTQTGDSAPQKKEGDSTSSSSKEQNGDVRSTVNRMSVQPAEGFDVSASCVQPVFRSQPWAFDDEEDAVVRILFLSEGNVCRSVYAQAIFQRLLRENGLEDAIHCNSKGARDYNRGEEPDSRAVEVAAELQLELPADKRAELFDHEKDIVLYDLVLVFDKFNAADVLKEVSVYDTIRSGGGYSARVRRLGEFCQSRPLEDIDDPLYGNMGTPEEKELLRQVYVDVRDSCEGLLSVLLQIQSSVSEGQTFKEGVQQHLRGMKALEWLVPPMLQPR